MAKTIVVKSTVEIDGSTYSENASIYLVGDNTVNMSKENVEIGINIDGTPKLAIFNPKTAQVNLHTNVTELKNDGIEYLKGTSIKRSDWVGHKYTYDGSSWGNNSSYVAPIIRCENNRTCEGYGTPPELVCNTCGKTVPVQL